MAALTLVRYFAIVALALLSPAGTAAETTLRIDEARSRLVRVQNVSTLRFAVSGDFARDVGVHIGLELVDVDDAVLARISRDSLIKRGARQLDIPLDQALRAASTPSGVPSHWHRLRYRISPLTTGEAFAEVHGTLSVSELTPDAFVLRVAAPAYTAAGGHRRLHVFALHPASGLAVANVSLSGKITISDDSGERTLLDTARTNGSGFARLDFDFPAGLAVPEATFEVTGSRGDFTVLVGDDLNLEDRPQDQILLSTDKPLYQPGQLLRIRALAFDAAGTALAGAPVRLDIRDSEFSTVYRSEESTSKFGEADFSWPIPEGARLGDYFVEVEVGDSSQPVSKRVKISRYDLPAFTVSHKADRPFYLPGQNAQVEIRGDYLFGKPVTEGHVRVVRESRRTWNYRAQKWETNDQVVMEGALDSAGRFLALVDLGQDHERLGALNDDYQDIRYAAYLTDAGTGRTEQRRFDLRITRDPIHVYAIEHSNGAGLPMEVYVLAVYADGRPAKAAIRAFEVPEDRSWSDSDLHESNAQLRRVFRTNRYGVSKLTGMRPASSLLFVADDGKGGQGRRRLGASAEGDAIRIDTNGVLYRSGQPIEVAITSSFKQGPVVIEVFREESVLYSTAVRLRNGKAFTVIPFNPAFKDDVTVRAVFAGPQQDSLVSDTRTVAYPANRQLQIDARLDRSVYAPGDEATATFRVRTAEGLTKPALLGVVVLDKAIEERAREENESGRGFWFCEFCLEGRRPYAEIAGLSRRDLDRIDLTKPVADDLLLVAELLLNASPGGGRFLPSLTDEDSDAEHSFANAINRQIDPFRAALNSLFSRSGEHPVDLASLQSLSLREGLDFRAARDPWDVAYRPSFSIEEGRDLMRWESAGPDKRFGTADDFTAASFNWAYFQPLGRSIDIALREHHARTGVFIRDLPALRSELAMQGQDLEAWRDRWSRPYRVEFAIAGQSFVIRVESSGPDGVFQTGGAFPSDDFVIWTSVVSYADQVQQNLRTVVDRFYQEVKGFPETREHYETAVRLAGLQDVLRDPWQRSYYPVFKAEYGYATRTRIVTYRDYRRRYVDPVTAQSQVIVLRSAGRDGVEGTSDDFDVASAERTIAEQAPSDAAPQFKADAPVLTGNNGAIAGTVVDATAARIPGVSIQARSTGQPSMTISDMSGEFLLRDLPPGVYDVTFELPGFRSLTIRQVPVEAARTTEASVMLELAFTAETVEVAITAESTLLSASASLGSAEAQLSATPGLITTPRLRDYFPETLLWQPAVETDRSGRAQVKFKLADNLTTWKMAAVASTVDGEIAILDKEITSFQPFFVEHEPPKFLTQGDEISLPVLVRSYLDKEQSVQLSLNSAASFVADTTPRKFTLNARETARETFAVKAVAPSAEAVQRVTAIGTRASDAIAKPVTVRPDGRQVIQASTELLRGELTHAFTIPADAVANTPEAMLKIYPNVMAHVIDGIEGVLQRPYGCAEQAISSAYPSLMLLRQYAAGAASSDAFRAKARRYLQSGIDRLRNYQEYRGGFSYWGRGEADIAVTAYALQFLNDAREFGAFDESMMSWAFQWLAGRQQADGSWLENNGPQVLAAGRSIALTALVARAMSAPGVREVLQRESSGRARPAAVITAAMEYLEQRSSELDDPYALASLALAAKNMGNREMAARAVERLVTIAHREPLGTYWDLQTNTPFYGWGMAGRVETTALAVKALAGAGHDALVDEGLVFLLRSKDQFGVWHSTQATVNVLDALLTGAAGASTVAGQSAVEVLVNGREVASVPIAGTGLSGPTLIDLSRFVGTGSNRIQVRASGSSVATAHFVDSYYVPWTDDSATGGALSLAVTFDRTEAKTGDEIVGRVAAERIGFRGYGMMLAEIGLPPGAEVDRDSLEQAILAANWALYRYEIQPDRIVAYLWPRAGGTEFSFKFRMRFGIRAQSPPSTLYDYYNPEAQTVVRPVRFEIAEAGK